MADYLAFLRTKRVLGGAARCSGRSPRAGRSGGASASGITRIFLASPTAKDPLRRTAYLLDETPEHQRRVARATSSTLSSARRSSPRSALAAHRWARSGEDRRRPRALRSPARLRPGEHRPARARALRPRSSRAGSPPSTAWSTAGSCPKTKLERAWERGRDCASAHLFGMAASSPAELKSAKYVISAAGPLLPALGDDRPGRAGRGRLRRRCAAPHRRLEGPRVRAPGGLDAARHLRHRPDAVCDPTRDFPPSLGTMGRHRRAARRGPAPDQPAAALQPLRRRTSNGRTPTSPQSVTQMLLATEGPEGRTSSRPRTSPSPLRPDACQRCPFRKLCWEEHQ